MYFKDLSNEIILKIMDYLDAYDEYQALSNVNGRYHHLMNHRSHLGMILSLLNL